MGILGLDLGEKRIGVAHSDELNLLAHGIGFIENKNEVFVLRSIERFLDQYQIDKIVVGLPKTMKGEVGTQAEKVLGFVTALQKKLACPVLTWDERLTTVQAERSLIAQDVSRAKRKTKRDGIAAEIMLQSYLDFEREGKAKHV
ncbi:MAG: Holliday junction resolvase RuvX [Candidatus Omnitrophica bacterium]|nr:Holliday junction resolvase RuvX [Candidatus Omnitrophota bacterium]